MSDYRVVPIPEAVIREVRRTLHSPGYGHPAHRELASGYGPCRSCLATFREGEEQRLLFTYDAFAGIDPYPEPGPVFVHLEPCTPHQGTGFPEQLATLPLTLEAFADDRHLVRREHLEGREPDGLVRELLALPSVRYLNLRNSRAGCFIARVEPAGAGGHDEARAFQLAGESTSAPRSTSSWRSSERWQDASSAQ